MHLRNIPVLRDIGGFLNPKPYGSLVGTLLDPFKGILESLGMKFGRDTAFCRQLLQVVWPRTEGKLPMRAM